MSVRLQLNSIPLALCDLEDVLRAEGIAVFNYAQVNQYLDAQCAALTATSAAKKDYKTFQWYWHPVAKYNWHNEPKISHGQYSKPIPMPVLYTIECILSRFPRAQFYVSKIELFPDSFLAVSVSGSEVLHVIERWDELSFRGWTTEENQGRRNGHASEGAA
jgi:hypothetical protein